MRRRTFRIWSEQLKKDGFAYDDGALVVDVRRRDDTKEIPPCMILKSDGASLYATTDLATLVKRGRLPSGPGHLCGRQASGTAFCTGIPLCEKDRNRK